MFYVNFEFSENGFYLRKNLELFFIFDRKITHFRGNYYLENWI